LAFVVVYDACVLHPACLRDLLIRLAQTHLFRARWTQEILEEVIRRVVEHAGASEDAMRRTASLMLLRPGEQRDVDVSAAMRAGEHNGISFTGVAAPGSSADIMIWRSAGEPGSENIVATAGCTVRRPAVADETPTARTARGAVPRPSVRPLRTP
jgi:hypothetical protein